MTVVQVSLTIFFEAPFWVGLFEKIENEELTVAKVIFGSEPKDYQVYTFILEHYATLSFSPAVKTVGNRCKLNPKRMQREIRKQTRQKGIGTKAQQAMKLQQEQTKKARKTDSKERKELEKAKKFQLKQVKKKAKHKGH
ncbi:YjdF family protein [Enterococcus sp. LJL99]